MLRHIVINLTKIEDKEKILKGNRKKKQITYNGIPKKLSVHFSTKSLQGRRQWNDIFKVMKKEKKKIQPRIVYPGCLSF